MGRPGGIKEGTNDMKAIYSPNYPKLMAAPGPKCPKWGPNRPGRVGLKCVKPKGHDGRHLMDVDPRLLSPEWLAANAPDGVK